MASLITHRYSLSRLHTFTPSNTPSFCSITTRNKSRVSFHTTNSLSKISTAACSPPNRLLLPQWSSKRPFPRISHQRSFYQSGSSSSILSTDHAHSLMGIPPNQRFTSKQLKVRYYKRCKMFHPDQSPHDNETATAMFLKLTDAYDVLKSRCVLHNDNFSHDDDDDDYDYETYSSQREHSEGYEFYTLAEEEAYRKDCDHWVQCTAELVEEMKSDAGFREWLKGKTDAAYHWKNFLCIHGGLLPKKLRGPIVLLEKGGRRRRTRRR